MKKQAIGVILAASLLLAGCQTIGRGLERAQELHGASAELAATSVEARSQLRAQLALGQITLDEFNEASAEIDRAVLETATEIKVAGIEEIKLLAKSVKTEVVGNIPAAVDAGITSAATGQGPLGILFSVLGSLAVGAAGAGQVRKKRDEREAVARGEAEAIALAATQRLSAERDRSRLAQGLKTEATLPVS